jgi:hypothetical protein
VKRDSRSHVPAARRRSLLAVLAVVTAGAGFALIGPDTAHAGLAHSTGPVFPTAIRLGATDVPVSLVLTNNNTPNNVNTANTVCNFGDPLPCAAGDPGITLIPSCGGLGLQSACVAPDPGVFRMSTTAVGAPRTECAGMTFTITEIDPVYGQYRFTPDNGQHVELAAAGSVCRIDFTVDMVKMPDVDWKPGTAGLQTVQVADSSVVADSSLTAFGRGTSQGVTALRNTPSIATVASPPIEIDGQINDTATVSGLISPIPGATVTFNLYGLDDPTCAAAPVHTSTVPLREDFTATSEPYVVHAAGQLHWIATYNGDRNNEPVSGVCSDPSEISTVNRHQPAIATQATVTSQVGYDINDVATVTGLLRPAPDATVTFVLYGPDDASCVTQPAASSTVPLVLDASGTSGTATAQPFQTTLPGMYRWIATYNGDANNAPVSGTCGDATETVMVTRTPIPTGLLPETR